MLIKELKTIIENLPQDADVVMQKHTKENFRIFAPVLEHRVTAISDKKGCLHKRLILVNDKVLKELKDGIKNGSNWNDC